jgi:phytoene dehydrogenase-like protein
MQRYDVVICGGGHNGLVAAAYLGRAGRSVALLERLPQLGGAAISAAPFAGVEARLSRYAYLVSLLPEAVGRELGLELELRRRRISSYTPVSSGGLLVDSQDAVRTRESMTALTGDPSSFDAWEAFYAMTGRVARNLFETLTQPLRSRDEVRRLIGDENAWSAIFERPIAEIVREHFADDTLRGVVLTDALIGTFTDPGDASLLANRCFLYHVIGNGTGDWDVPVGGMGAVSAALVDAAHAAGAELRTGVEVTALEPGATSVKVSFEGGELEASHVLVNAAPAVLDRLLGAEASGPAPEGAQLKVNMLLSRLPRLLDSSVDASDAFAGTFHVNESESQMRTAYQQALRAEIPDVPPCEIYCHSLTDPSILSPALHAAGAHTLTLFGLHMPARVFAGPGHDALRARALEATLRSLDSVLAEPIEDCLLRDAAGAPCIEVKTPIDLEHDVGLPGGHIFHRDLTWPFAEDDADVGLWGVETEHERILLCGAGARRGGGVSGIPGHNAAMALLVGSVR